MERAGFETQSFQLFGTRICLLLILTGISWGALERGVWAYPDLPYCYQAIPSSSFSDIAWV